MKNHEKDKPIEKAGSHYCSVQRNPWEIVNLGSNNKHSSLHLKLLGRTHIKLYDFKEFLKSLPRLQYLKLPEKPGLKKRSRQRGSAMLS